jgi:hypothetical protein
VLGMFTPGQCQWELSNNRSAVFREGDFGVV